MRIVTVPHVTQGLPRLISFEVLGLCVTIQWRGRFPAWEKERWVWRMSIGPVNTGEGCS